VGYHPTMTSEADTLPEDPAALQAMVLGLRAEIAGIAAANRAYEALVQALKITIARLKKQRFGKSSEKIEREIEQLELALESLETARAAADATPEADTPESEDTPATGDAAPDSVPRQRRRGKPRISEDAPRETIVLDPGEHCPDCGGVLRLVGDDVAEILDFIAAKLKVVEIHRPRKSCRDCERMVQTPAPPRRSAGRPSTGRPPCPPHPARDGRPRAPRTYPGRQVRRPAPALSPGRDLRPHGS
jgi:Transposase and inactivated derivatives